MKQKLKIVEEIDLSNVDEADIIAAIAALEKMLS
jgi:hypothetical protein